jgi:hypothetical protein
MKSTAGDPLTPSLLAKTGEGDHGFPGEKLSGERRPVTRA